MNIDAHQIKFRFIQGKFANPFDVKNFTCFELSVTSIVKKILFLVRGQIFKTEISF